MAIWLKQKSCKNLICRRRSWINFWRNRGNRSMSKRIISSMNCLHITFNKSNPWIETRVRTEWRSRMANSSTSRSSSMTTTNSTTATLSGRTYSTSWIAPSAGPKKIKKRRLRDCEKMTWSRKLSFKRFKILGVWGALHFSSGTAALSWMGSVRLI